MKSSSDGFRVRPGKNVELTEWPTIGKPICKSKKEYQNLLKEHVEELIFLQRLHYASNRYALLLIFQAIDAGGKDGSIRRVMSGVDPQGCEVSSFKQPGAGESAYSIVPIMKRRWWFGCIQRFSATRKAYEDCLTATSTRHAPWYVAPADDKESARLTVSRIVLDTLNELKMAYPETTAKRRRELESIRKELTK